MNWDQVQGNWAEMSGKSFMTVGQAHGSRSRRSAGRKTSSLVLSRKERYGMEKEKAHQEIERWVSNLREKIANADGPKLKLGCAEVPPLPSRGGTG